MGDPTTSQAIGPVAAAVATPIKDTIWGYVKRHFSYVFFYEGNIKKLKEEIKELCQKRERIQAKVDSAQNSAQVTYDEVSSWLNQVQVAEKEVDDFLANERKENKQCFKCMCPNLIWRYRLGKGAEGKRIIVASLKEKGGKLESSEVAQPARFPTEMLETYSEDYMNFQSRDLAFTKILEALKDSNVKMILVHGPGGVGKTRIVKEVTKQINKWELFEQVVEATISQEPNVKDIQDQLAAQLNLKFDRDDVTSRKGQLYNRLKHTKKMVLVIMDDVWKKEDMEGIGVPFTDCKILITSRYEGLCERKPDQKDFSIGVLMQMEAWELFKKTTVDISDDDSMAREVCKECGGLPLAILAVGATLKGKRTHAWKDALQKLKNANMPEIPGISPKIYTSLKLSYDNLNNAQKSLFLLFCLFPEDVEVSIDNLVRFSMALQLLSDVETLDQARDNVLALVEYLKSSNLLLNGKNEYFSKMHDIIRDVAIYITKRKESQTEHDNSRWPESQQFLVKHNIQKWPEKGTWEYSSAISLRLRNVNVELPNDCSCPKLHTLILEPGMLKLPQDFFGGMEKVTVLVLIQISMLSLPSSLASLVNLRMLFLKGCKLGKMNVLKDLKDSIEILSLKGSKIEVLPSEIGQLTRLHLLDLESVWPLQVIPKGVFSNLLNLEELYVPCKFKNWGCSNLEDEIKSSQLTTLHIHVPDVHLIKNLPLERLTRFQILVGNVSGLPDHYFSTTRRILRISSVHIKDELKILFEKTEELYLTLLEGLKCLDRLLGELKYSSRSFSKLTSLSIQNCGFKYLLSPSCARSLQQLQCLEINGCQNLEFIVATNLDGMEDKYNNDNVIQLPHLRVLVLARTSNLKGFCNSSKSSKLQPLFNCQVVCPTLKTLNIKDLHKITEIWDDVILLSRTSFCELQNLVVSNCENIESIVSLSEDAKEKGAIRDFIIEFPALESIELRCLVNFKGFYNLKSETQRLSLFNHQVLFPHVNILEIVGLASIKKVWEVEGMILLPCQLRSLYIQNCPKLEEIIPVPKKVKEANTSNNDVITFSTLERLCLWNLPNFRIFYSSLSEGQYFLNHQVSFPVLKDMKIGQLTNIIKIWEVESMIQLLSQLRSLEITVCPKVEVIVSILAKEKEATVTNNDVIKYPALNELTLWGLPNLKNFYSSLMEGQYLFNHQILFPALKNLKIGGLMNIMKIWEVESMILLPNQLQSLQIEDCPKIEVIISIPKKEKEATASNNNDVITFPALDLLYLQRLPNFEKFYSSMPKGPYLFNHQVEFPCLKFLNIFAMTNIEEVWGDTLPINSFSQLREVVLKDCNKLTSLASSKLLTRLQRFQSLDIGQCDSLQMIFRTEGWNKVETNAGEFMFPPQLRQLKIEDLPSLESFFSEPPLFQLPSTVWLIENNCPKWRNVPNC